MLISFAVVGQLINVVRVTVVVYFNAKCNQSRSLIALYLIECSC